MKNCSHCKEYFNDQAERCPKCGRLLNSGDGRSRVVASPDSNFTEPLNGTENGMFYQNENVGNRDDGYVETVHTESSRNMDGEGRASGHRLRAWPVVRAWLHYAIPAVLIFLGIFMIITYREAIIVFLRSALVGAVVGAVSALFLCFYFRRFSGNMISGCAIAGAIIAVLIQYNLFGIKDGLAALFQSILMIVILLSGIALLCRSVFRR